MSSRAPIEIRTLAGAFGAAEVKGLDPALHTDDASASEVLRAALWKHGVVCVRLSRSLSADEAHALASMIGPVKDPIGRTLDGGQLRYSDVIHRHARRIRTSRP